MSDSSRYGEERLYIGGEWVKPIDGESAISVDPATGEEWATVAFAGRKDIDRAVAAANEALRGPWGAMSGWDRANLLRKFAALYEKHAPRLAELETRDNGRAIRESRADVGNHHNWYQYYASLADKLDGRVVPFDRNMHIYTTSVPVGVVGAIVPWNAPLLTTAWKLGPALAAGCTVVLKPAETTPVSALELARIAEEAGLPKGVLNVVPGLGHVAGAHLTSHSEVNKIAFTGETRTAQEIMRAGAVNMKRLSFELGGKAPHIIFDDADLDHALNAAIHSGFVGCGQSCALGSRLFLHRSIYDRAVEEIGRRAERIRVGDPLSEATQMGPQAHDQQLAKTLQYIDIGRGEGARLVAGGERLHGDQYDRGCFVKPTLFADVNNKMRIAQEEIFGPVIAAIPFSDEDEVVAMANDTQYGLTAGLWTRDLSRAHRISARIEAGMVWVNTYRFIRWSIPYGGFKMSGLGRENGPEALANYLETRSTVMSLTGAYPDAYAE